MTVKNDFSQFYKRLNCLKYWTSWDKKSYYNALSKFKFSVKEYDNYIMVYFNFNGWYVNSARFTASELDKFNNWFDWILDIFSLLEKY